MGKIRKTCEQCGKEFERYPSLAGRFCSNECSGLWHRGENAPAWKGGNVKKSCEQCGKGFEVRLVEQRLCSQKCFGLSRRTRVEKFCEVCGQSFITYPSRIKEGGGRFCSTKCMGLERRAKIKRTCEQCGKEFEVVPSTVEKGHGKFCSLACNGLAKVGENSPVWAGDDIMRVCEQCEKEFGIRPAVAKQHSAGRFCSTLCRSNWLSEYMSGENSPNWRGGISFEPYGPEWTDKLKEEVRKRDEHTCAISGEVWQVGQDKFHVHHINYCKTDNRPENLITLCHGCHGKTTTNRQYWETFLSPITIGGGLTNDT